MSNTRVATLLRFGVSVGLVLASSAGTAWAHVRPQTTSPSAGDRLDASPAHISITYDGPADPSGTAIEVLDSTGAPVATTVEPGSPTRGSVTPAADLSPGPYTVHWTTRDAADGHEAAGFYAFVVNGGPLGILTGSATAQAAAASLTASLTVSPAEDGSSLLRVGLSDTTAVERIRIRLSRPDLGEVLLDTRPTGAGEWLLNGNEIAVPGAWHADVIVRRTNIFEDATAAFDFQVDPATGVPSFVS